MSDEVIIPRTGEDNNHKKLIIIVLAILILIIIGVVSYIIYSKLTVKAPGDGIVDPYDLNSISYVGTFKTEPTNEVYGVRSGNVYSNGSLSITNFGGRTGSSRFSLIHKPGALEGYSKDKNSLGDIDTYWANTPPDPNDAWLVVYSSPYGVELSRDSRPANSLTPIEITLAVILSRSEEMNITSGNNLLLELGDSENGMDFSGKTITIKQTYPEKIQTIIYPTHDVRDVITNRNGIIELPAINGIYKNGQIYAKFLIEFSE